MAKKISQDFKIIKVFFDASVLFSGFYSPIGASRALLEMTKINLIHGITTQTVIEELKNNLEKFTKPIDIGRLINDYQIIVREKITRQELSLFKNLVEEKDLHILTGAILTSCQYLVTLDKKHLNNQKVKKKITQIKIVSPKELLKIIISKFTSPPHKTSPDLL